MTGSTSAPPRVIALHGYNTRGEYIRRLERPFREQGFRFYPYIYGKRWIGPLGNLIVNRFRTRDIARGIVNMVQAMAPEPVILVGHSHGLYLSWLVQQECENVVGVVGINGCLQRDAEFGCWMLNAYCPTDWVLKIARWRPFSQWGDYGTRPYQGQFNINLRTFGVSGHSDVFDNPLALAHIARRCRNINRTHNDR